jgi:16S rRNA (guanine966-N2)-methyltransferase
VKPVQRKTGEQNTVRLIGGRWGGRKIHFPDGEGLRPTPSRVRETLFNWLMQDVRDARVLDLFAGSGALAFEALSRGAREAVLVDLSATVCAQLGKELAALHGTEARVVRQDAERFLARPADTPYDIVFLDPPFHRGLLPSIVAALESNGFLHDGSIIYIESETIPDLATLPAHWRLHRQQEAGQVCYSLFICGTRSETN